MSVERRPTRRPVAASPTAATGELARPLRADARRNRERVLKVAQEVFAAEGPAVEIDEIARRAGVGVGTIYRHFPTKEALAQAIVSGHLERLLLHARSLVTADNPGDAFFAFLSRFVEEGAAKRDLMAALSNHGLRVPCPTTGRADELRDVVSQLLVRAQHAGSVRHDVGAEELLALVAATIMAGKCQGSERSSQQRLLGIVCDGLRRIGTPKSPIAS